VPAGPRRVAAVLTRHVVVHTAATLAAGVALRAFRPRLDARWFAVRPAEGALHRRAGVRGYARLLRAADWDRVVARVRGFDGTRGGLAALERHTRLSEASHLLGGAVAVALLAARADRPVRGALSAAGSAVLLHAHPVLLQRALRARIAALRAAR
jgi:hypothetical protein